MKLTFSLLILSLVIVSCTKEPAKEDKSPIVGTWKLFKGTLIEDGDTTVTNYTGDLSFIKIINETHFAFLQHDLSQGKDTATAVFVAGGGAYSLRDNVYEEHLEYCSARNWEGNDFKFTITIRNDTLIQRGVEKVENVGVDRINEEKYVRLQSAPTLLPKD